MEERRVGSFIYIVKNEDTAIIEEKRKELEQRLECVFNESGMMKMERLQLYGKQIGTLRPVKIKDGYTTFYYNQIEEDAWENAGYTTKEGVYSNKVGWGAFSVSVAAAYILQTFYMNGPAYVVRDGYLIIPWRYMEWFRYLFGETYLLPDADLMRMVEIFHKEGISLPDVFEQSEELANSGYILESMIDAIAVIHGTKYIYKLIDKDSEHKQDKNFYYDDCIRAIDGNIERFKQNSPLDDGQQVQDLMDIIYKLADADEITERGENKKEAFGLQFFIKLSGNYAFAIKRISELYNRDFWELYQPIIGKKRKNFFSKNIENDYEQMVESMSTSKFFCENDDDMLQVWKPNRDMQVSEELEGWFEEIKRKFDTYIQEGRTITKPIRQIMEDLYYANVNYLNIYVNADFLEETLDNIEDIRYQAIWKIFHEIIYSPKVMEEGEKIFDQEALKQGIRQTKYSWTMTNYELKRNEGRMKVRRYLALVANLELRKKVFGF